MEVLRSLPIKSLNWDSGGIAEDLSLLIACYTENGFTCEE